MKKLICLMAVLLLCASAAAGEGIDLSGMTDEELRDLRVRINEELAVRSRPVDGEVLLENANVRVVLASVEIRDDYGDVKRVVIDLEWTNLSARDAYLQLYLYASVYVDGIKVMPRLDDFGTTIRPNVTLGARVVFSAAAGQQAEIVFSSYSFSAPIRTFEISVR